ncbi:MAG TPA: MarR family transcriptional regulator [Kofleriaceae bacterium]|nr:MarR family transcriptional regulator [Kofleriaceae bacterium]
MSVRRKALDRIVETTIYLQTESRRLAREQCDRLGITATQLSVIKMLEQVGDLSLSELSKRMATTNSTVTGIVDRMESAGLVERARSEEDRRVWIIRLTTQGKKVAEKAKVSPWEILKGALAELPPTDQERLTAILKKLVNNVTTQVEGKENGTRR